MRQALIAGFLLFASACTKPAPSEAPRPDASAPVVLVVPDANVPDSDVPTWVSEEAHLSEDGLYVYGVGKAKGIRNGSLLRSTAENRARASIARFLADASNAAVTLQSVEIVERFVDEDGVVFALARMPVRDRGSRKTGS